LHEVQRLSRRAFYQDDSTGLVAGRVWPSVLQGQSDPDRRIAVSRLYGPRNPCSECAFLAQSFTGFR
jgi:hypothetical protein